MIKNLPIWIEYSVFFLALLAGLVNAVGLLGFEHQSVSHLSGTATLLGVKIIKTDSSAIHLLFILLSFVFGSGITGFLITSNTFKFGKHYDTILFLEGLLIFASFFFLNFHSIFGHYLASAACGMQNALVTTYSGAIIRTTHLTGVFTDLGIMIGEAFRGVPFSKRKFILYCSIIFGFILGGTIGSLLFNILEFKALFVPSFFSIILAFIYKLYYRSDK